MADRNEWVLDWSAQGEDPTRVLVDVYLNDTFQDTMSFERNKNPTKATAEKLLRSRYDMGRRDSIVHKGGDAIPA